MKHTRNSVFIILIFFFIYGIGSFDKIPFGDCMALVLDTELAVFVQKATPTSHFLYTNTAVLLAKITSFDALFISRYLVILCGAFVVMMVYKTVYLVTKKDWVSFVAAFVFGFSFTFWRNASIVEVYTFNLVWLSLFLHYFISAFLTGTGRARNMVLSSLFLSVSLWAHIQNIFFIPALALMIYWFRNDRRAAGISVMLPIFSFVLMIGLNAVNGLGVFSIFKSGESAWVANTFRKDVFTYLKDMVKAAGYLFYNFNLFTLVGIYGVVKLYDFNRKLFYAVSVAAVLLFGFATFYAVSDNYVFFLPFNYMFALSVGLGLKHLSAFRATAPLSTSCLLIPVFYFLSFNVAERIPATQQFNEMKAYKGGLRYYLLPWMNSNVGILEFTLENRTAPEAMNWMSDSARDYISILKKRGMTEAEIKQR